MTSRFNIHQRSSAGNLHISIMGEFNGQCAWELLKVLKGHGTRAGRVFVDTAGIAAILPDGVVLFKSHMAHKQLPSDWLYFKGKKGFKIAPDSSRVITMQKCGKQRRLIQKNTRPSNRIISEKRKGFNPKK